MPEFRFDPRDYSPSEAFIKAQGIGLPERQARRLLSKVIGESISSIEELDELNLFSKDSLSKIELPRLKLIETSESKLDRFRKLLFQTQDNLAIETVIIPLLKEDSFTICLSSQVGCVMGCAFCATAKLPERRNLKTWEIIDQFIQARKILQLSGQKVTGVVFMGMGEPFLNYNNVISAAKLLCYPIKNSISGKAITISTVGLVEEIARFTRESLPFRLSISLGAATDEKRAKLVPVASRTPIKEVIAAARTYAEARKDRVNLSYVCISGENVFESDARALGELIKDTPIRLDLIDVRDSSGRFLPPSAEELNKFRDALRLHLKQPVARRYSGGGDIEAGCGMLAGKRINSLRIIDGLAD
jgi:23S rRNA (adenine2503-C2)-methyltransferase